MSGVQPCLTAIGVCQPNIGDVQMLLTPAMCFPAHDHRLDGAPVLVIRAVMPFFSGFTPNTSTGFSFGCPGSDYEVLVRFRDMHGLF